MHAPLVHGYGSIRQRCVHPGHVRSPEWDQLRRPLVSGAAALLLARYPTLTPDAIKARLMKTARENVFPASSTFTYTNPARTQIVRNDLFTVGAGYLDISAAMNDTTSAAPAKLALSPTAGPDTTGCPNRQTTCINVTHASNSLFPSSSWSSSVLWGSGSIDHFAVLKDGDQ
ncbi:MAG: S8 family serine peptidase [Acidobacteriota bacterium]